MFIIKHFLYQNHVANTEVCIKPWVLHTVTPLIKTHDLRKNLFGVTVFTETKAKGDPSLCSLRERARLWDRQQKYKASFWSPSYSVTVRTGPWTGDSTYKSPSGPQGRLSHDSVQVPPVPASVARKSGTKWLSFSSNSISSPSQVSEIFHSHGGA